MNAEVLECGSEAVVAAVRLAPVLRDEPRWSVDGRESRSRWRHRQKEKGMAMYLLPRWTCCLYSVPVCTSSLPSVADS